MTRRYANPGSGKNSAQATPPAGADGAGSDGAPPAEAPAPDFAPMNLREMANLLDPALSGDPSDPRTQFFGPIPQSEEEIEVSSPAEQASPAPVQPAVATQTGLVAVKLEDGKEILVPEAAAPAIQYQVELQKREKGDKDRALAQVNRLQAQIDAIMNGQMAVAPVQKAPAAPQPVVHGQAVSKVLSAVQKMDQENGFGGGLASAFSELASALRQEIMADTKDQVFNPVSEYVADFKNQSAQIAQFFAADQLKGQVSAEIGAYAQRYPHLKDSFDTSEITGRVAQLEQYAAQAGLQHTRGEIIATVINDTLAKMVAAPPPAAAPTPAPQVSAPAPSNGRSFSDRVVPAGSMAVSSAQPSQRTSNGTNRTPTIRELLGFQG